MAFTSLVNNRIYRNFAEMMEAESNGDKRRMTVETMNEPEVSLYAKMDAREARRFHAFLVEILTLNTHPMDEETKSIVKTFQLALENNDKFASTHNNNSLSRGA